MAKLLLGDISTSGTANLPKKRIPTALLAIVYFPRMRELLSTNSPDPHAMDSQSRQTASTYINNLLLSRGLLRNGTPIEFAKPEEADGGLHATMSQVMNLVHDLILRRDVCDSP